MAGRRVELQFARRRPYVARMIWKTLTSHRWQAARERASAGSSSRAVVAAVLLATASAAMAGTSHPLSGTRWTATEGAQPGLPRPAAATQTIRLLGEVHDNVEHHKLRAVGLDRATGAVVFEQLRTDQQQAIDAFMAQPKESRTLDAFFKAVGWEKSGWSKYDYKPLFQAVLDAGLPIYAGDPPRDLIRKAAKEGAAAIPADEQKRLGLDVPLDPSLHEASLTEIEASHCGMMPKAAFGGMAFAQRFRDATLADVALKALEQHGAVTVFAGNGHVRGDRGVPWYIRHRAPKVGSPTTLLVEVEDSKNEADAYVPRGPDGKPATDTIIFTPRAEREDPCKAFRNAAPAPAPSTAPPGSPVTKN